MPSLSTFILQLNTCHQLRYSLLFIYFFDVTYPVTSNRLLTTKAKWQTEHCHWRRLSHRGHTVTCVTWSRGSVDISVISLAVWKAAEVTYFVSGPWYLQFSRYSRFFQLLKPLPPDLLLLPSWFPCYVPLAWHWSGAVFPQSTAPFRLQWSWWKCFCRKKATCSDRLWRHHVIMLQSRLSLLRKLQWTGFGFMIMWL